MGLNILYLANWYDEVMTSNAMQIFGLPYKCCFHCRGLDVDAMIGSVMMLLMLWLVLSWCCWCYDWFSHDAIDTMISAFMMLLMLWLVLSWCYYWSYDWCCHVVFCTLCLGLIFAASFSCATVWWILPFLVSWCSPECRNYLLLQYHAWTLQ